MSEHTKLIQKFKLQPETDFYVDEQGTKVIKKPGYLKIKRQISAEVKVEMISHSDDHQHAIIKATGTATMDNKPRYSESYGEVSPKNNNFYYPIAICQKRAEGRVVLDLAGLTEDGYVTEDELSTVIKNNITKDSDASIDRTKKLLKEKDAKTIGKVTRL
jgi:hypothetical protein